MNLSALVPAPGASGAFEFRVLRAFPDKAGCYALSTASGEILYVGQARSLQSRLLQHWEAGRHKLQTNCGRISRVSIIVVAEPAALNSYERGWINQCELADGVRPALNKISAPV
jgi:excinuclease UvrABC nuclease subunit